MPLQNMGFGSLDYIRLKFYSSSWVRTEVSSWLRKAEAVQTFLGVLQSQEGRKSLAITLVADENRALAKTHKSLVDNVNIRIQILEREWQNSQR